MALRSRRASSLGVCPSSNPFHVVLKTVSWWGSQSWLQPLFKRLSGAVSCLRVPKATSGRFTSINGQKSVSYPVAAEWSRPSRAVFPQYPPSHRYCRSQPDDPPGTKISLMIQLSLRRSRRLSTPSAIENTKRTQDRRPPSCGSKLQNEPNASPKRSYTKTSEKQTRPFKPPAHPRTRATSNRVQPPILVCRGERVSAPSKNRRARSQPDPWFAIHPPVAPDRRMGTEGVLHVSRSPLRASRHSVASAC